MRNVIIIILGLFAIACSSKSDYNKDNKQNCLSFISQEYLDSIDCPPYVIIIDDKNIVAFHLSLNCRYVASAKKNPKIISSDSIPDTLHACKYCLKHALIKDTVIVIEKNKFNEKKKISKNKKKQIPITHRHHLNEPYMEGSYRNPLDDFVE